MKLLVLAIAYLMMGMLDLKYNEYGYTLYHTCAAYSFFVVLCSTFCIAVYTKNYIIWGYGVLNLTGLILFSLLTDPDNYILVSWLVYDATINFRLILMSYEILLLSLGMKDAIIYIIGLFNDDYHRVNHGSVMFGGD